MTFFGRSDRGDLSDIDLAAEIADGAGRILQAIRHGSLLDDGVLGDTGDRLAQAWIARVLQRYRPHDAVLSEEAPDSTERLSAERVWVIDPLDGTRDYAAHRPDYAVHVALTQGGQPVQSAVSLPAMGQVFRSDTVVPPTGSLTGNLALSRSRATPGMFRVAESLDLHPVSLGSAGVKTMAVVTGQVDVYLHAGGQYEWDSCAPVGVARAAGLHCSRLDGSELTYNNPDPYLPDLVICRPELAEKVLAALN
ncbi:3'(2'),5'-bisphosphate nucleotidase CysQ [Tsukamurella pseudospumae]|uniref:3'(2'),5'-bisphosphate nucleotidase CysQ n=1 Tax=Tsukamurella pseudospumae TaxID=239498 RepID=A0A137ZZT4_9ACTN|nr:3'(2'),5'-bisphosphate nucleotidase CysQ [Tsukamurella pseudospumae]KXO89214.1 3'(2'),5'-bisphosphate nucleotidase CysQ [Tsukamurella pseudospumae]KXP03677.1 3'(2'),5'-bisphosphate nucleotidase CysQ [Tsukamurella pseudospumae]